MEEIKLLAQHGIAGVLAGVMFWFYRQDRASSQDQYVKLGLDFRSIVEANTAAMTKLCTTIEDKSK